MLGSVGGRGYVVEVDIGDVSVEHALEDCVDKAR